MRPAICLIASFLLLSYGTASTWSIWTYRNTAPAAPFWCKRWLLDEEQLAQQIYPLQWESEAGRAAAVSNFQLVLTRDPASARRWCDLAEALIEAGGEQRARYCLMQALARAPQSPIINIRTANSYFRLGEPRKALRQLSSVLQRVSDYDEVVFSTYSRFAPDIREILDNGMPADPRASHSYLRYLLAQKHLVDAGVTWEWIRAHSLADTGVAAAYVTALLKADRPQDAVAAWAAYLGNKRGEYLASTYLFNGDFESDPSGCPLDWHIEPDDSAEVALDHQVSHSGTASLRIRFNGTEDINYHHVWQTAVIPPGEYRLEAWMRADGISTTEGVGLRAIDPKAANRVDSGTVRLKGSTGWTRVEAIFRVPSETETIEVQVRRAPSRGVDDKLSGSVWIDGVTLRRIG